MPFWFTAVLWLGSLIIGELLRPKPDIQNAKAAGLGDFTVPTATEGRQLPVVWGTRTLKGPNVVWYGDLQTVAITEKTKTGLFSSKRVTTGYQYYLGIQLALCHGRIDAITQIKAGDDVIWTGSAGSGLITIDKPGLWGGEKDGGGISGNFRVHDGSGNQAANSYVASHVSGSLPGYVGAAHVVWEAGYIGTSTFIQPFSFQVQRMPRNLDTHYANINGSANPAEAIYEILIDDAWGIGLTGADIDTVSFITAAQTLHGEGHGLDMIWDSQKSSDEVILAILNQIDGTLFVDVQTGAFTLALARNDYTVGNLLTLDESTIVTLKKYSRGAWDETTNEVRIDYVDEGRDAMQRQAVAQDTANVALQGAIVSTTIKYQGVAKADLAAQLAARDLRQLTYPTAKVELQCNRAAAVLRPGSVFKWTWPDLGITDMVMRVTRVGYGDLLNGAVTLEAVQDIYDVSQAIYGAPEPTGWADPVSAPLQTALEDVFEVPLHIACLRGGLSPTPEAITAWADNAIALPVAANPGGQLDYKRQRYETGVYRDDGYHPFTPTARLSAGITGHYQDTTLPYDTDIGMAGLVVEPGDFLVLGAEPDDEWMWITAIDTVNRTITVKRGAFDTVPRTHPVGTRLWVVSRGDVDDQPHTYSSTMRYRFVPRTLRDQLADTSGAWVSNATGRRNDCAIVPGWIRFNATLTPLYINGPLSISWRDRSRFSPDFLVNDQAGFFDAISYGSDDAGYTVTIRIYDEPDGLARTINLSGGETAYTYPIADEQSDTPLPGGRLNAHLRITVWANATDAIQSWQTYEWEFDRSGWDMRYGEYYGG